MTPIETLTAFVLLLAFVGYVWCLTRLLWITLAVTGGLAYYFSRNFPIEAANIIYWGMAAGVFVAAVLVMLFVPGQVHAPKSNAKPHKKRSSSRPKRKKAPQARPRSRKQTTASAPKRKPVPQATVVPSKRTTPRTDQREIVIDGTNVMYWDGEADLRTLRSVVDKLVGKNMLPYVFLDASSRHHLGDTSLNTGSFAKALGLAQGQVTVCPTETDADAFILRFAKEHSLPVVSNDRFGDRTAQAKGLKLIKGVIARGKPIFHGL